VRETDASDRVDLLVVRDSIVTDLTVDTRGEHVKLMDDGVLTQR
jgi:hypothetical protein